MHVRAHVLHIVVDWRVLALQLVQLVDPGVVCNADAMQTVDLVVHSNGLGWRCNVRVIYEAFAFGNERLPGVLGPK
jgi:hypothetical protein